MLAAMRIAIADTARIWGGAEKIMLQVAGGLRARGHEVLLFVRPDAPVSQRVPPQVSCVPLPGGIDLNPLAILKTIRTLRRWQAHVLIIWTTKDARGAGVGGRLAGVPVLVRQAYETGLKRTLRHRIYQEWVPTRYMTNAKATRQTLLRSIPALAPADVAVIYNGLNLDDIDAVPPAHLDVPPASLTVGFVARLDHVKGLRELAAAWPVVARRVPRAHLVFAGTGEQAEQARG